MQQAEEPDLQNHAHPAHFLTLATAFSPLKAENISAGQDVKLGHRMPKGMRRDSNVGDVSLLTVLFDQLLNVPLANGFVVCSFRYTFSTSFK